DARAFVFSEDAAHRRGDCRRAGLLDSAHRHAQMDRFDHDHHAFRLQVAKIEQFGDLSGKALLYLWAARVNVNDARQLRQPDDAPFFRYVGDVRDAGEGKQMVFAERGDGDVLNHYDLIVRFSRNYFDLTGRVFVQSAADLLIHLGHTTG